MVTDSTQFFQRPAPTHTKTNTLRNTHTHAETHIHTPRLAGLIQTAGLLSRLPRVMLVSVACCPEGTILTLCLQGLTGPPSPEGRCSSIPSHRLLSAALLMSSSALRSSLTASALQMDSTVIESAARRSWIGVWEFQQWIFVCAACMDGWMDKQASPNKNA